MVKPWDIATIGDFLDFKNGLNKGKEFFGYGTPIVNYTDVYKKRGLKKADIQGRVCLTPDEIHRFDVRKNDVFFTRTSETPDEVGMSSVLLENVENGVFSGFVLRGRPKNDMFVPEYCKYCFSTEAVRNAIITGCTYTTRALTNGKQLSAIEIPIPPKPEQEAIAAALSDIDTLIANLEKLIAKKKAIKQGAMQELLTGKRRLPGFEEEWNTYRFGDIFVILPNNAFTRAEMSDSGVVKNIHYGDILTKYHEYIFAESNEIPYIASSVDLSRFSDKCFVKSGDIIIADTIEMYCYNNFCYEPVEDKYLAVCFYEKSTETIRLYPENYCLVSFNHKGTKDYLQMDSATAGYLPILEEQAAEYEKEKNWTCHQDKSEDFLRERFTWLIGEEIKKKNNNVKFCIVDSLIR